MGFLLSFFYSYQLIFNRCCSHNFNRLSFSFFYHALTLTHLENVNDKMLTHCLVFRSNLLYLFSFCFLCLSFFFFVFLDFYYLFLFSLFFIFFILLSFLIFPLCACCSISEKKQGLLVTGLV